MKQEIFDETFATDWSSNGKFEICKIEFKRSVNYNNIIKNLFLSKKLKYKLDVSNA